jgi:phosphopantothenoylcysteine decarboxylase/phosphopantothenate--cysteine ligase
MGYAIALALADEGAKVSLVSGPTQIRINHPAVTIIDVMQAEEMYEASVALFPNCDGAIMAAAVADFTPVYSADSKVKRGKENWNIELKPTKDIAAALGQLKKENQLLVGFALETDNEESNAQGKLLKKNLDFIVLNSLRDQGAGFKHDTNKISIIDKTGEKVIFDLKHKNEVARDIVNKIITYFSTENATN